MQASASALPHWPAPVSVARRVAALALVVEGLRDRGVRLVAPGRADALVLVEDPRPRARGRLEPVRAVERRRAPEAVDVEHLVRDRDLRLLADLLQDQLHREERREVVRPDRLPGARMQDRLHRVRHVGADVVPAPRELGLGQQVLGLRHARSIVRPPRPPTTPTVRCSDAARVGTISLSATSQPALAPALVALALFAVISSALATTAQPSRRATSSTAGCSSARTAARAIAWPPRRRTATSARTSPSSGSTTRTRSGDLGGLSTMPGFKRRSSRLRSATSPRSSPKRRTAHASGRAQPSTLSAAAVACFRASGEMNSLRGGCSQATGDAAGLRVDPRRLLAFD